MRAAVISDVHGNLAALEIVLSAVDEAAPDELWCLGDLAGYGARPEECAATVLDRADICLCGNHDMVVTGVLPSRSFTHDAAAAATWAQQVMSAPTLDRLRTLEPSGERAGVALYHASARDPVWEYVIDERTAAANITASGRPLTLVGHSHVPLIYTAGGTRGTHGGYAMESTVELGDSTHLLNPGSVGQPRDGDPRASFLLLDTDRGTATWRRLEYDIARTQREITEAGLPPTLAYRLAEGR